MFEEIVKDELKRVKQNLSNATRDENLGHDCKVLFKCILSVANFEETSKIESVLQLLLHLQTFCVENFVYTLPILYSQRLFLLFVYTLKSLSQTVRNHDALLNCEPQLRKVISPTQNHSRQIKSIIYIPVITIKTNCCKNNHYCLTYIKTQPHRKSSFSLWCNQMKFVSILHNLADWESSREQILDWHSTIKTNHLPQP